MKHRLGVILLAAMAAPATTANVNKERTVDLEAGGYVDAIIENRPVRLRVDMDAPANFIQLNPATVKRVGIRGFRRQIYANVDSRWLTMTRGSANFEIGSRWERRAVYWSEKRNVADDADGVIGPMVLPENRVTYRLRAPAAGEQTIELPLNVDRFRIGNSFTLGRYTVALSFAPQKPQSVATAAAGAHLAAVSDGRWAGPPTTVQAQSWLEPPQSRPARALALGKPISLAGLPVRGFVVRTADYRGTFRLPPDEEAARLAETPSQDEIVVVAKRQRGSNGEGVLQLALGRDALGGCSSITVDRRRELMTLSCRTI